MSRRYARGISRGVGTKVGVVMFLLVAAYVACAIGAPEQTANGTTFVLARIGTLIEAFQK